MLIKYNLHDNQEKYPGVFYKNILSADLNQIPFNVSIIRVSSSCSTNLHNHHDSEFLTILSGEGEIRLNGKSYIVSVGDIIYIDPFNTHMILNNHSTQELLFTSCWWFIPAQLKKLIENDIKTKSLLPESTVIISSFPTPNGSLHLGHLSGPFIAEDIYARFLKQHGKSVFMTCGLDQNQTWCGIEGNDTTLSHSVLIKNTLSTFQFQSDYFIEPIDNKEYTQLTQNIFSDLMSSGSLFSKKVNVFICERTKKYLADSEITGFCPYCQASIRGNNCEQCFSFINDADIVDPKALDPKIKLGTIQKERIYFPLSRYQKIIKEFINNSILNSNLKQTCLKLLSKSLPDIPITHYYPWGISLKQNTFSGQYICYYFEQIARLIYTLRNSDSLTEHSISQVVRFFGIDNVFMYSLFSPAITHAFQPLLFSKLASNANQYYLLDNQKFSTSRKHAIWADEFIEKWGSDLSRLYLAYTRPEDYQSNFSKKDFMNFYGTLQNEWCTWLTELFSEIKTQLNSKIPEAGSWDFFQENYLSMLHKSVNEASNYLLLDNFSTREYVHILLEISKRANRLRKKYTFYQESDDLKAYYRTAIALQASTAHVLAIISWPVMPNFANKLYNSLGMPGMPIQDWSALPQLLPSSLTISTLPLLFKEKHGSVTA